MSTKFDLFLSYAHEDNQGVHVGKVTAIRDAIADCHRETCPNDPLEIFFDTVSIVTLDYWKAKILTGLEQSAVMVAILSPGYFRSAWCRREWETFAELELQRTYPGEAISPIYVIQHPDFDQNESQVLDPWIKDLKNRQYVDLRPFWPDGAAAFNRQEVRERVKDLHKALWNRVQKVQIFRRQPWNVPVTRNQVFVGREHDLASLNERLKTRQTVGVSAVSGLGGIGKTTLALRYAQKFREHYPGGVFYLACSELGTEMDFYREFSNLAPILLERPNATDEERRTASLGLAEIAQLQAEDERSAAVGDRTQRAFNKVKQLFSGGERKLLVLDDVKAPALLSESFRKANLPAPQTVRQLITTRMGRDDLGGVDVMTVELLDRSEALSLLCRWRPFALDLQSAEFRAACAEDDRFDETSLSPSDPEWKAALAIVNRVGRLTIAVEQIAIYLSFNQEITFYAFLEGLRRKGIGAKLDEVGRDRLVKQWVQHPTTLMGALFEPTFEQLPTVALRILEFAAYLPKDHVPVNWLRNLINLDDEVKGLLTHDDDQPDPFYQAMRILSDRQLLHGMSGPASFPAVRMHEILGEILKNRLGTHASARMQSVITFVDRRAALLQTSNLAPSELPEVDALSALVLSHIEEGDSALGRVAGSVSMLLLRRGNIGQAKQCAELGVRLSEDRAKKAPENAAYARDLAVSYDRMGDLFRALGDVVKALGFYQNVLEISERLSSASPANLDYAHDLSAICRQMGGLLGALGDGVKSREFCERSLAISEQLSSAAPANAEYARDLSVSYTHMGDSFRAIGDDVKSLEFYEKALVVSERLSTAAPENAEFARDLSVNYERLGNFFHELGDGVKSREFHEKALVVSERLSSAAPENADYARDLLTAYIKMGDSFRASGDGVKSQEFYEKSLAISERLSSTAPQNAHYTRDVWVSCVKLGQLFLAIGNDFKSLEYCEKALVVSERLSSAAPENGDYARCLSISHDNLFYTLNQTDVKRAAWHLSESVRIMTALLQHGALPNTEDQKVLENRAELARRLGIRA